MILPRIWTKTSPLFIVKNHITRILLLLQTASMAATLSAALPAEKNSGAPRPLSVVFEDGVTRHNWTLPELSEAGFDLPADWSGFHYLVVDMRVSSPEKFNLWIQDNQRWWHLKVYPMQGVWFRANIPLKYYRSPDQQGYDVAALGNKSGETFFLGLTHARAQLTGVTALGVETQNSSRSPRIQIRGIRLAEKSLGNRLLEPGPVLDEFGQWIPDNWPGKATSLEQLQADWRTEEQALVGSIAEGFNRFGYGKFGGFADGPVNPMRATGFFRVEKQDGRWWLVDPEGLPFFSTGANGVDWWSGTFAQAVEWRGQHYEGREEMFALLPPESVKTPSWAWSSAVPQISFHTWNLQRRHGSAADWTAKWRELAYRRMADWGINTVPNWAAPDLYRENRMAYVRMLHSWGVQEGIMGLPDVYSRQWHDHVDAVARRLCAPHRDDPWLLGYFIGNEPPFPRRESLVVDAILKGPDTATRRHLAGWLAAGDTPERRVTWIYDAWKHFLDHVIAAVRHYDPNHLILGVRYASPSEEILRVSSGFDVVSFNSYREAPDSKVLDNIARLLDKPVLIGEFSFGTPGRGLAGCLDSAIVKDHQARGVAYQHYMEQAAANPAVVGAYWFQWVDQPATGRLDGERYNLGLVDVTDRPYPELIDALRRTHRRLGNIHAGKEAPVSLKAGRQ